jgi:transposase-like protein
MARQFESDGEVFWQRLMARRKTSGLTVAALCQEAGVSPASFFSWQKRLRQRSATSKDESPVAFPQRSTVSAVSSPLVPVRIIDDGAAEITVEFLTGEPLAPTLRVRFPAGCDERSIFDVLQAAARVATSNQRE